MRRDSHATDDFLADMAASRARMASFFNRKWDEYVNREYVSYIHGKDAAWDKSTRQMEALGKLGAGIGGVTAALAGAFAIPIAAGPTSVLEGGASFSASIGARVPQIATATTATAGGAAALPQLEEKIEEALPLVEDAAAATEEGFTVTGKGLIENAPNVAKFFTDTVRPYTGSGHQIPFQQAFEKVEQFVLQYEKEGSALNVCNPDARRPRRISSNHQLLRNGQYLICILPRSDPRQT